MMSLKALLAIVLLISFTVFILFFGRLPAFRETPIGALNRAISVHLPQSLLKLDRKFTGGRIWYFAAKWFRFLMTERHPTVLIMFILLMLIPELMFVPSVWETVDSLTKASMVMVIVAPYGFLYLSAYTDPGKIDSRTYEFHSKLYPYDHILFDPGRKCATCRIIKPARSKHCSTCGFCISRCDHHCIFINSCVGYNNLHYFIGLLVTTSFLTAAGAYLGTTFLLQKIHFSYPGFTFIGHGLTWPEYFLFWSYILHTFPSVGSITLLCILTSPLVWGLTSYQIYLIWAGTTTNETGKWAGWKAAMDEGCVFGRRLDLSRVRDPVYETNATSWPKQPEEILVRMMNGREPDHETSERMEGVGPWERVWTLREIENVYDIGFTGNLMDMLRRR